MRNVNKEHFVFHKLIQNRFILTMRNVNAGERFRIKWVDSGFYINYEECKLVKMQHQL